MEGNSYTNLSEVDKFALRKQRFELGDNKINTIDSLKVSL
jgi:hypothetical protein